jgi:hypothetical protein
MQRTRAQFKLALCSCRQNEEQLWWDALANAYLNNIDNFWKKVEVSASGRMTKYSCVIGDATTDEAIAKVWKDYYEKLYNQHNNDKIVVDTAKYSLNNDYAITFADVCCSINNLKVGKAYGPDGIAAEAVKYGDELLVIHLTLLFNMFVTHCYILQDLIVTMIVPMLKNKAGDVTDVNNKHAIALSNIA